MTSSHEEATIKPEATAKVIEVPTQAVQKFDDFCMDFGSALRAMRKGCRVARLSWGNPGKYVFLNPPEEMFDPETGAQVGLKEHLVWKNDKGEFVPWTASQDAVLADDWFIGKSGERTHSGESKEKSTSVKSQGRSETFTAIFVPRKGALLGKVEESLLDALVEAADDWYRDEGHTLVTEKVEFYSAEARCGCIGMTHSIQCRYHVPTH